MPNCQNIPEIVGKYVEEGGGTGVLMVTFTQRVDGTWDISIDRQENPLSRVCGSHTFHSLWKDGEFRAKVVSERYKNEWRDEEKVLKTLRMGEEPRNYNFLTVVIAEYRVLNYQLMLERGQTTAEKWKEDSDPENKSLLQVYSKLQFLRNGVVNFSLRRHDNSIEKNIVFRREDQIRRTLYKNDEGREEAEKLFAAYDECLKTVLNFADGQSQILLAATIKQELVTDCRIVEEDEEVTGEESKKEDVGEDKDRKEGEEKGGERGEDEDKEDEN